MGDVCCLYGDEYKELVRSLKGQICDKERKAVCCPRDCECGQRRNFIEVEFRNMITSDGHYEISL